MKLYHSVSFQNSQQPAEIAVLQSPENSMDADLNAAINIGVENGAFYSNDYADYSWEDEDSGTATSSSKSTALSFRAISSTPEILEDVLYTGADQILNEVTGEMICLRSSTAASPGLLTGLNFDLFS
jgi:hypothetical protein